MGTPTRNDPKLPFSAGGGLLTWFGCIKRAPLNQVCECLT